MQKFIKTPDLSSVPNYYDKWFKYRGGDVCSNGESI